MRAILGFNSSISFQALRPRLAAPPTLLAAALCWTQLLLAQTPAIAPPPAAVHRAAHRHKGTAAALAHQTPPQGAVLPEKPPAPELPLWPANEKPQEASVTWDSQGLYISAVNSSLDQILKDIAAKTGATVEGLTADERIFGVYGPGKARDVLSQLLLGSGYNVLMVGDQGQGTPREIVLSSRNDTGSKTVAANPNPAPDDADADDEIQPQPIPPGRMGFGQRTPQEIQQELQQRNQEMQQMLQRQQQQPPPNNPQ